MRIRFRVERNYHPIFLAHGVNICILLVTLVMGTAYINSLGTDAGVRDPLASHLVLLIVAPWFFFERMLLCSVGLTQSRKILPFR